MAFDKVLKGVVDHQVGAEEAVPAVAGVDKVMSTLRFAAVRQRVAPDTITQSDEVSARWLRRQKVFCFLPRYEP